MTGGTAVTVALTFCWLGMVLAISFLEAPLKFRAPGVTTEIGLGIGRLVFRALNGIEAVLAIGLIAGLTTSDLPRNAIIAVGAAIVVLVVQVFAVRPALRRRTAAVLDAGPDADSVPRSHVHLWYVGLEVVKVVVLIVGGVLVLQAI